MKVLDFGLAKAWAGDASGVNSGSAALSQSPTLAHTGTIAGVILGTAAYMSPEQARGKPVDKRADVWSFGVLVWEMLTGRSLFAGDTVTDVIASVVKEEPDLDALPEGTPRAVRRLIERCLRKDPRTRLPDIGAARLEIQDVLAGRDTQGQASSGGDSVKAAETERQGRRKERWAWAAAATLLGGVATTLALAQLREAPQPPPPAVQFVVDPPDGWRFHFWGWPIPSPDGSQILFRAVPEATARDAASEDASTMLWTRPLETLAPRLLAGTERVEIPFWSPDGQFVAFFAGGELRKLNLASGAIQRICAVPPGYPSGADWSPDGTIAFAASAGGDPELFTVPAAGGEPRAFAPGGPSDGGPARAFPSSCLAGSVWASPPGGRICRQAGTSLRSTRPTTADAWSTASSASRPRAATLSSCRTAPWSLSPSTPRARRSAGAPSRSRPPWVPRRRFPASDGSASPPRARSPTWPHRR